MANGSTVTLLRNTSLFDGIPQIFIDGARTTGSVTVVNSARVRFTTSFADGALFYTLDGSYPGTGPFFSSPFILTESATIRVIAYTADFAYSVEAPPLQVTVVKSPTVATQPQSQSRIVGGTASFSVTASGTAPLAYQWYFNGNPIPSQISSTLTLLNVQLSDAGEYSVAVANEYGSTSSLPATLTVYDLPRIAAQPPSTNVVLSQSASFNVLAGGFPPPIYQWRLNGVNLTGETNASLRISQVQLAGGGAYSVIVANAFGVTISQPAQLLVQATSTQPGDNFVDGLSISGSSGFISGSNASATRETGEPNKAGKIGGKSVWYRWRAPSDGIITFTTRGSTFDTLLGAYLGTTVSNLNLVVSDEDAGGALTSEIKFNATSGVEYNVAVDGYAGAGGYFLLSWNLEPTSALVPTISQQPRSLAVLPSSDASFSVTASGGALTYQWLKNDHEILGETGPSLFIPKVDITNLGSYTVRISNAFGRSITSFPASLELVSQPSPPTQDKLADVDAFTPPIQFLPAGKGRAGLTPVSFGSVGFQFFQNVHSSTDPIDPASCAIGGASRWLKIVASIDGTMSIDTITSQVFTVVAVYRGGEVSDIVPSKLIACDVNSAPDGHSLVRFQAQQGVTNSVLVDGINGAIGTIFLHYCLGSAPLVAGSSDAPLVVEGTTLSLIGPVSGGIPPPSYQWYRNGAAINGATTANYSVDNVQTSAAGLYSLVASNCLGVSSNVIARVTIQIPLHLGYSTTTNGGRWEFNLNGSASHAFTIQGTTNFLNWIPFYTNATPFAPVTVPDPASLTLPYRFYRAIPWP